MLTDEEISEAVKSLLSEWSRRAGGGRSVMTLNQVVEELQAKLGGHDLTHKLDFITRHINYLLSSPQPKPQQQQQQQQQPPQQLPSHHPRHQQLLPPEDHKDHFALSRNPNFPTAAPASAPLTSSSFSTFPSNAAPPLKPDAHAAAGGTEAPAPAPAPAANEVPKESTQTKAKRKGGPGGLNKLCGVSPELQVIVGQPALPRTEIVKQLWVYIRKNNLQDPSNKRKIICNDELRVVFETDCTDMFKMNKLLAKHIIPLEPTKKPVPKKQKVDVESGTRSAESTPAVIISDALANFFGVTGREMLQSEVLRRIWEYIKVNQLEDPGNSMEIVCDEKLQKLFGCESISAMGIHDVLGHHHILRRS